jgi:predicted nucleic acid-binding Zn finger protein
MTTSTISPIQQIDGMTERLSKAREIFAQGRVHPLIGKEGHYTVQGSRGEYYLVNGECSCSDAQYRAYLHNGWCKHRLAAQLYREAQPEGHAGVTPTESTSVDQELADLYR